MTPQSIAAAVIEAAARVCDAYAVSTGYVRASQCAKAIRALDVDAIVKAHSGWIAVTERLPEGELSHTVITLDSRGNVSADEFWPEEQEFWPANGKGEYWADKVTDITHWMKLPEPPGAIVNAAGQVAITLSHSVSGPASKPGGEMRPGWVMVPEEPTQEMIEECERRETLLARLSDLFVAMPEVYELAEAINEITALRAALYYERRAVELALGATDAKEPAYKTGTHKKANHDLLKACAALQRKTRRRG